MGELIRREAASAPLPFSGERLTSGVAGAQVGIEHYHRYLVARDFCRGRDVLDVASGEGYGTALLAQVARSTVGVEIDPAAVAAARTEFVRPNLRYEEGDARALPLPDASIDVAVSFETLEHMLEHDVFLSELHRVLRPDGLLIISTPDRDVYSAAGTPPNPYHVLELTKAKFEALIRRNFAHAAFAAQRPVIGTVMVGTSEATATRIFERRSDTHIEASDRLPRAPYLIALASDAALPPLPDGAYIHRSDLDADMRARVEAEARSRAADASAAEAIRRADALKGEAAAARARVEAAAEARNRAEVALGGKDAEIAQIRARAAQAEEHLQAVLRSTSWHLTAPLRHLGSRSPALARYARRGIKLAWWTVTLQLPFHYRLWRDPRTGVAAPSDKTGGAGQFERARQRIEAAASESRSAAAPDRGPDEKARFTAQARGQLRSFLASQKHLTFPRPDRPDVSVVVVVWNQAHLTLRCLRALLEQRGPSIELVVVDNGSTDETPALLSRINGARILRSTGNDGFLLACNQGAAASRGRALLLLNSDASVRPGALSAALATLDAAPDIGAVGGRLVLPSGRLQEAGSIVWSDGSTLGYGRGLSPEAGEVMFRRDVDFCSGAFLLTPWELWERLGGFDKAYAPAYYEDVDYCVRARAAGFRIVYEPAAVADHYEYGSEAAPGEGTGRLLQNRKLFRERHARALRLAHLPVGDGNVLAAREDRGRGRPHLLMIDNEVPLSSLGSGYPRAKEMLACAVAAGWSVGLFQLHRLDVDWDAARAEIPWEVEIIPDRGALGLADFLLERIGYYDAVLVSRPDNMALLREAIRDRPHVLYGTRLIYDAEAVFANREIARAALEARPHSREASNALIEAEVLQADGCDAIICVSDAEADIFRTRQTAPVYIVSHAVEPATATPAFANRSGFLFVGRLLEQETPNWEGLRWFIRACWPLIRTNLPNATLSVVGRLHPQHTELEAPGVCLCGLAADLRPFYDAARVFLAPARFAAGIPIKILEATAAGLPTAGTRLMAHQLAWAPGVEMVAEDDPTALAAAITALHEGAAVWERMRGAARERVEQEHSPAALCASLQAILTGASPSRRDAGLRRPYESACGGTELSGACDSLSSDKGDR